MAEVADIVEAWSGVAINGESVPPGQYSVKEGDEIYYQVWVQNIGNIYTRICARAIDWVADKTIDSKCEELLVGEFIKLTGTMKVMGEGGVELMFRSLYDDPEKERTVIDEEYGNWILSTGGELPPWVTWVGAGALGLVALIMVVRR